MENTSTRIQDNEFEIDDGEDAVDDHISNLGLNDLVDVGSKRGFLIPGDLVELMCVYTPPAPNICK